jgi:hypothetical protein
MWCLWRCTHVRAARALSTHTRVPLQLRPVAPASQPHRRARSCPRPPPTPSQTAPRRWACGPWPAAGGGVRVGWWRRQCERRCGLTTADARLRSPPPHPSPAHALPQVHPVAGRAAAATLASSTCCTSHTPMAPVRPPSKASNASRHASISSPVSAMAAAAALAACPGERECRARRLRCAAGVTARRLDGQPACDAAA